MREINERMVSYAATLAEIEGVSFAADDMLDYLNKMWVVPSTPVRSSFGDVDAKNRAPISCFVRSIKDDIDDITFANYELETLTVRGGGVAQDLSKVRPVGSPISGGGKTAGIIPFAVRACTSAAGMQQGNIRRGALALYLHIDHPEVLEFIDIRKATGEPKRRVVGNESAHHAIILTDEFMKGIAADIMWKDTGYKCREIWKNILITRMETGEPYIMFEENCHKNRSEVYSELNIKPELSNLCVTPDTTLLTKSGFLPICDLVGEELDIWNGFEWSAVTPQKTGENQEVYKVILSDGRELTCTDYHKWYVIKRYYHDSPIEKRTIDLKVGDRLMKHTLPIIEGVKTLDMAYANGFYSGDGCALRNGRQRVYFYNDKKKLIQRCSLPEGTVEYKGQNNRIYVDLPIGTLEHKFFVPSAEYTLESRLEWLAGLYDADATMHRNGSCESIILCNTNLRFLHLVSELFGSIGITSKITSCHPAGVRELPMNDGSGMNKGYECNETYRLIITSVDTYKLYQMGFNTSRIKYNNHLPNRNASHLVKVVSVEKQDYLSDTYCVTEPKRGLALFNGILTGNCSEILLSTREGDTNICCLASFNLLHFEQYCHDQSFFNTVSLFMALVLLDTERQDCMNQFSTMRLKNSIAQERSIGLGVMGFHNYIQTKGLMMEDDKTQLLNMRVFSIIHTMLLYANRWVFIEMKGSPCVVEGKTSTLPVYFANMTAIAPTATISKVAGDMSLGIEPYYAPTYVDTSAKGVRTVVTTSRDKPWIEMDQLKLLRLAADRQQFIDQAQSINLLFAPDVKFSVLHKVHYSAWEMGIKTLYYCRSLAPTANVCSIDNKDCQSCQ